MSSENDLPIMGTPVMSPYEAQVWDALHQHWERRNNRRGLPNWAGNALERTSEVTRSAVTRSAVSRSAQAVPDVIKKPVSIAGGARRERPCHHPHPYGRHGHLRAAPRWESPQATDGFTPA